MPIDTQTPNSPGWWLARLLKKLAAERFRRDQLDSYFCGTAGIPVTSSKATRAAYIRLMALARTNYARLVVESVRERMQVTGFRTGAVGDDTSDDEAWRIWQANSLDADSHLVHRAQLVMADGYVIVGGPDEEIGAPLITPEDPRNVVTEADPRRTRRTIAALKLYNDDVDGLDRACLYLPGCVFKASRKTKSISGTPLSDMNGWAWTTDGEKLPFPVVPVVRFANDPDASGRSMGEFEPHISILDRINYGTLNRLEVVTLQAFRQRGIKGVPNQDASGNDIDYDDIFAADPGALWLLPETAEVWESGQVDLTPMHTAARDDVMDLAAVTRTPLFYLTPDATNGSAEGASLAREGLVFKTGDRIIQASESWEAVMSLAFMFSGDTVRASRGDMECLWAPPERFSLSERADAATKAQAGGMPWAAVMRNVWQLSPQEIMRLEAERATDLLFAAPAPPVAPETPVAPLEAPQPV